MSFTTDNWGGGVCRQNQQLWAWQDSEEKLRAGGWAKPGLEEPLFPSFCQEATWSQACGDQSGGSALCAQGTLLQSQKPCQGAQVQAVLL